LLEFGVGAFPDGSHCGEQRVVAGVADGEVAALDRGGRRAVTARVQAKLVLR